MKKCLVRIALTFVLIFISVLCVCVPRVQAVGISSTNVIIPKVHVPKVPKSKVVPPKSSLSKLPKYHVGEAGCGSYRYLEKGMHGSRVAPSSVPMQLSKFPTINSNLAGKLHPETGILYREVVILVNGVEKVGIFPRFESVFTTNLPGNLLKASRNEHFVYCSQTLAKEISHNPTLAAKFTERQLMQIKMGMPKIDNLTWHHNEQIGVMELVDEKIHALTRHTGGFVVWGANSI